MVAKGKTSLPLHTSAWDPMGSLPLLDKQKPISSKHNSLPTSPCANRGQSWQKGGSLNPALPSFCSISFQKYLFYHPPPTHLRGNNSTTPPPPSSPYPPITLSGAKPHKAAPQRRHRGTRWEKAEGQKGSGSARCLHGAAGTRGLASP